MLDAGRDQQSIEGGPTGGQQAFTDIGNQSGRQALRRTPQGCLAMIPEQLHQLVDQLGLVLTAGPGILPPCLRQHFLTFFWLIWVSFLSQIAAHWGNKVLWTSNDNSTNHARKPGPLGVSTKPG
jgi:hypothetical protein